MRIFLIENNIHIKKVVQDFTLMQNSASLQKLITVPFDIDRLKRELSLETPNILIIDIDNYKSPYTELDLFLQEEKFKYTSFIMTSKESSPPISFQTKINFVQLSSYALEDKPEVDILKGLLRQKLEAFGKIKSRIKSEIKRKDIQKIEDETKRAILKVSRGLDDLKETLPKVNPELDRVVPNNSMLINKKIVVVGSSIGGVEVLGKIMSLLPTEGKIPPILVTQHIPIAFTGGLVDRLDKINPNIKVHMGKNNMILLPNNVYVAPGDRHMGIAKNGFDVVIKIFEDEVLVSKHKPSIDVLYRSANNVVGKNALAVILTGMGKDGVQGMGELHKSGALTIAQEKKTCTVQGIAGECIVRGYIKKELSIEEIVEVIKGF